MPLQEPPWITGTSDLEPSDDHGQPKTKPDFLGACNQFYLAFHQEPWFVRLIVPHDTENLMVCVVDASTWPGRCKNTPWMGYAVAVAQVSRDIAEKERKKMVDDLPNEPAEHHIAAVKAFHEKYGQADWFLSVYTGFSDNGIELITVGVDRRKWPNPKADHFTHGKQRYPVVVCLVPGELVDVEEQAGEF